MQACAVHAAGYFKGVMGTGEHARQLVAALRTQGIPVTATTLHPEASPEDEGLIELGDRDGRVDRPADFNLLCANADAVPGVADRLGEGFFGDAYTIGFWAWEVSTFPERFMPAFDYVDEVWVGSRHVRDAVARIAAVPVRVIPQPVSLPAEAARAAPPSRLPEGFRFVFAFDYLSVFERKNPLAAVAAFSRAFAPGSGTVLIVKSLNHEADRAAHERLRAAAAQHPDIHLIERRLSREERDGLMSAADCYVSLHRAEGFGYTLAEAMWLAKPVIATGYSGNVDFMTAENSYPVRHRLVPIGPGNDPYPADGRWAEPDIDHAARLMREVFEDRTQASRRAERAATEIRATHGPEVSGRAMAGRLEQLIASAARRSAGRGARRAGAIHMSCAAGLISSEPPQPGRTRFGPAQQLARKGLLRLLKPVTVHQRLVNTELLEALEALDTGMRALGRSHEVALRRIEELEAELGDLRGAGAE